MLNNDTLVINGTIPSNVLIDLKQGYNLIGYPSLEEKNISIITNNINNSLNNVLSYENGTWFSYSPSKNNELNELNIMKPGFGYWVNLKNNTVWSLD